MLEFKLVTSRKYHFPASRKLEDIELKEVGIISIGSGLEDKIKGLVCALRILGLETIGSCEGHLNDPNRWPYPWVTAYCLERYKDLDQLIERYNNTSQIKWKIDENSLQPTIGASNENELRELQENAQS